MKPSSTEKTQTDTKQTIQSGSCLGDNKPAVPASTTSKREIRPGFKVTILGPVSFMLKQTEEADVVACNNTTTTTTTTTTVLQPLDFVRDYPNELVPEW